MDAPGCPNYKGCGSNQTYQNPFWFYFLGVSLQAGYVGIKAYTIPARHSRHSPGRHSLTKCSMFS